MPLFESFSRRMDQITPVLTKYGIKDLEEARLLCLARGIDVHKIVKSIQSICFENALWAYTLGAAIALKKDVKTAAESAEVPHLAPAALRPWPIGRHGDGSP
mgnify:CR=1 FL=1